MKQLSATSLMLAVKSLDIEIKRHEAKLTTGDLSDEDADYYGQYVLDLTRAFSEVASAYEDARQIDARLPAVEKLLRDAD